MALAQDASNALATTMVAGSTATWMGWIEANSIALTVIIVFTTGAASFVLNLWSKKQELKLSKERNEILRGKD